MRFIARVLLTAIVGVVAVVIFIEVLFWAFGRLLSV